MRHIDHRSSLTARARAFLAPKPLFDESGFGIRHGFGVGIVYAIDLQFIDFYVYSLIDLVFSFDVFLDQDR